MVAPDSSRGNIFPEKRLAKKKKKKAQKNMVVFLGFAT